MRITTTYLMLLALFLPNTLAVAAPPAAKLVGHTDRVRSVAFSPDGSLLATGNIDASVRLWETEFWGEKRTCRTHHRGMVHSVAFSPDGQTLASGGRGEVVCLKDGKTGERKRRLVGHTDSVHSVAFSPDGKLLASGSWDGTVFLWKITD